MTNGSEFSPSWVYSMADYCQMFDLKEGDLDFAILDYPAGISSFNAEMHQKGYAVQSGDSHYRLSLDEITRFSEKILDANVTHLKEHADILQGGRSFEVILEEWEDRRNLFLNDYEAGKQEGRYREMNLPRLPFENQVFDIALCSDHLFNDLVSDPEDHTAAIEELCRVAKEVRIFPLQNKKGAIAEDLGRVMLDTQQKGCGIEVREVPYHEMKGGNAMLRIWATKCIIAS